MDEITILLTLAQIAVGFAGFATLASILGRQYSRDDPKVDAFRLRNMLVYSLSVAAFSLYPILPIRLGWPPSRVWSACAGVALIWCIAMFVDVIIRIVYKRSLRGLHGFSQPMAVIHTMLGLATFVALSAIVGPAIARLLRGAGEVSGSPSFAIYLGALLLLLTSCGLSFVFVVYSLLFADDRTGGSPAR